jgi:hypothetical protein
MCDVLIREPLHALCAFATSAPGVEPLDPGEPAPGEPPVPTWQCAGPAPRGHHLSDPRDCPSAGRAFRGDHRRVPPGCALHRRVLIPDLRGDATPWHGGRAAPQFIHTTWRPCPNCSPPSGPAEFERSVELLVRVNGRGNSQKAGSWSALGETGPHVRRCWRHGRAGVDIVTSEFMRPAGRAGGGALGAPAEFDAFAALGRSWASPRLRPRAVRSSYNAARFARFVRTTACESACTTWDGYRNRGGPHHDPSPLPCFRQADTVAAMACLPS